jgi:hypothetical protein
MSREPYIEQRDAIRDLVGKLDVSKPWSITVEPYRKKRTNSQNALLHKWFDIIGRDTGYAAAEIKEIYRDMFLGTMPRDFGGEVRDVRRSTADLKSEEFSEFMDRVYQHATASLGVLLPLPEEAHLAA